MTASITKTFKALFTVEDQATKPLKQLKKDFAEFSSAAKEFGGNLKELGTLTLAPVMAGITALTATVKDSIQAFTDYGASVKNVALATNTDVEALQKLRYAASQSGSSAEQLDGALAILSKNMANAAAGSNKALAESLKGIGIDLYDVDGKLKSTSDLMPELADAFKNSTDAQEKARLATQLFGRQGLQLIQLLEQGSDGLNQLGEDAERLGVVLSTDVFMQGADFSDAMDKMKSSILGVKLSIGEQLIPIIRPMIDEMSEWIAANREWLATTIGDAVRDLIDGLKQIDFKAVVNGTLEFIKVSVDLFNKLGGLKTILITLSSLLAIKFVASVGGTVLSLGKMVTTIPGVITGLKGIVGALHLTKAALISTGIGALLVALGTAAAIIIENWDVVGPYFKAVFDKIWEYVKPVYDFFVDTFNAAVPIITAAWDVLSTYFQGLWDTITAIFEGFWNYVKALFNLAVDIIMGNWDELPQRFADLWEAIKKLFYEPFQKMCSWVSDTWDSIKSAFGLGGEETPEEAEIRKKINQDYQKQLQDLDPTYNTNAYDDPYNPQPLRTSNQVIESKNEARLDVNVRTDANTKVDVNADADPHTKLKVNQDTGNVR